MDESADQVLKSLPVDRGRRPDEFGADCHHRLPGKRTSVTPVAGVRIPLTILITMFRRNRTCEHLIREALLGLCSLDKLSALSLAFADSCNSVSWFVL